MEILHCGGGWPTNIGNAFIDFGIRYLIKKTMPNSKVYFASNATSWIYHTYSKPKRNINFLNLEGIIKADYYVFGGAMLNLDWFRSHYGLFHDLVKNKSKIIMLGVGGGDTYPDNEIEAVREYIEKLNMFILISRDKKAFASYQDLAEYSYDGVDCAFFLNDAFTHAKLDLPEYVVFTFDKMTEPNIEIEEKIIRTHHELWKFSSNPFFSIYGYEKFLWNIIHHQTNIIKKNDMLSDLPDDYLNLYANCKATYSDRIHACVATLAFGNSARLYSKSVRSLLLDRVGLSSIRDNLVSLDRGKIEKEKKKQIEFLTEVFAKLSQ
jgi:hypothetical protein